MLSIYGSAAPVDLDRFFSFFNPYTVSRTPWTADKPVARPLPTHRTTQTQNKCTQTSMARVGFEPTIAVFERAKTVHALDFAATVIRTNHVRVHELTLLISLGLMREKFMAFIFMGFFGRACVTALLTYQTVRGFILNNF
jgi:hypothetical protein